MDTTEKWKRTMLRQNTLLAERSFDQESPLPLRERVRVRGLCQLWSPSPHSSPVKGEEVSNFTADDKSTNVLLSSPASPRGSGLALIFLIIFSVVFAGLARVGSAAEGTRFLVSYGGTAGYQLPLWVNKEFGFSKKYGVDLEIILIQAGSPNIQALLGGSLQLTQTAASSSVIAAARGAPVVIVATLENKLPMQLISRPEIKEPQQLRGKTIGINRFGGSNDAAVLMAIKAWKMDPKDITMLQTGGTAARMAALLSNKVVCDGAVLSGNLPGAQARHERARGYRRFRFLYEHVEHRHPLLSATEPRGGKGFHQGANRGHALRQDQQRGKPENSQKTSPDYRR